MKNINLIEPIKMKKILPLFCAFLVVAAGCSTQNKNRPTSDITNPETGAVTDQQTVENVKTICIEKQKIARTIEYSSTIIASEEVHLAPSSPGKIEKIFVEIGDRVKKGNILVQMDRTQLHQAMVNLKNTETDFMRLDTLNKVGSISKQRYDQMKAQYEIAQSNVKFLQENTILRAPFNGVISGKYYEDDELYSGAPNTSAGKAAILSIVQIDPLKVIVNISEKYFPFVKKGMDARVTSDLYPEKKITGEVLRVYPTIDPSTRSFTCEIKIDNRNELLRPGMFCRVSLNLGEELALVVPAVAVLKMQGSNERYVFLEEDGVARYITVTLGKRFDDKLEVISDKITEGSNLIVSGQARLLDGDKVKVISD